MQKAVVSANLIGKQAKNRKSFWQKNSHLSPYLKTTGISVGKLLLVKSVVGLSYRYHIFVSDR